MRQSTSGKYTVILADPPWSYSNWSGKRATKRTAESHYRVMTLDEIKALPIADITADDAVLFMWAVSPDLPRCIEVMEAWGFTYKTVGFCWVKETKHGKDHFGMGHYTRPNVELCLFGTKGKPVPRQSRAIRQTQRHKIGRHSAKPAAFRRSIEELYGDVPRIELFARDVVPGWDAWGNEVDGVEALFQRAANG